MQFPVMAVNMIALVMVAGITANTNGAVLRNRKVALLKRIRNNAVCVVAPASGAMPETTKEIRRGTL